MPTLNHFGLPYSTSLYQPGYQQNSEQFRARRPLFLKVQNYIVRLHSGIHYTPSCDVLSHSVGEIDVASGLNLHFNYI